MVELGDGREIDIQNHAAGAAQAGHHFRQAVIGLGPEDHVHVRCAAQDLLALGLGDAAGHAEDHAPAGPFPQLFQAAQPAEFGIHLLGGLLADVTGIQDDHVRPLRMVDRDEAEGRQDVRHAGGVVDVHLTAESRYVKCLRQGGPRYRIGRPMRLHDRMTRLTVILAIRSSVWCSPVLKGSTQTRGVKPTPGFPCHRGDAGRAFSSIRWARRKAPAGARQV